MVDSFPLRGLPLSGTEPTLGWGGGGAVISESVEAVQRTLIIASVTTVVSGASRSLARGFEAGKTYADLSRPFHIPLSLQALPRHSKETLGLPAWRPAVGASPFTVGTTTPASQLARFWKQITWRLTPPAMLI